jgi:hypothetical protein
VKTVAKKSSLDHPFFWSEFLKRLSHWDVKHDAQVIRSLCDATGIEARDVMARLRTYCHYSDPSQAMH